MEESPGLFQVRVTLRTPAAAARPVGAAGRAVGSGFDEPGGGVGRADAGAVVVHRPQVVAVLAPVGEVVEQCTDVVDTPLPGTVAQGVQPERLPVDVSLWLTLYS